jgi:uncharacterized membrane protein YeaQ/YmgE (transglycosylase-associated protein family)
MDVEKLIWICLIGLAAGFLAGLVIKGHAFGLVGNLIVGVIGALVGGFVFRLLGLRTSGRLAELLCAFAGAVLLLYLLKFVKNKDSKSD